MVVFPVRDKKENGSLLIVASKDTEWDIFVLEIAVYCNHKQAPSWFESSWFAPFQYLIFWSICKHLQDTSKGKYR